MWLDTENQALSKAKDTEYLFLTYLLTTTSSSRSPDSIRNMIPINLTPTFMHFIALFFHPEHLVGSTPATQKCFFYFRIVNGLCWCIDFGG